MSANYRVYIGGSSLFFIFLAPGVIVHEISHALVCKILRVRIYEFKPLTFEKRGSLVVYGYVKREATDNPIKEALISTAPMYIGLLILSLFAILPFITNVGGELWRKFDFLLSISDKSIGNEPLNVMGSVIYLMFNVWVNNRFISPVFWVIPYLSLTILLSLRPSTDDLEKAFRGLIYIALIYGIVVLVSFFSTIIRYIFYGLFEFLLILLTLTLSLSIIGAIFLTILYLVFKTRGYLKIVPFIVAILLDILLYPILKTPITTIITMSTLILLLETTYLISKEGY